MTDWDLLLDHLANGPRENGTRELDAAMAWLSDTLTHAGVEVSRVEWTVQPDRLRIAGAVALAAGLVFAGLLQARFARIALAVAVAVPALLVAELDYGVSIFGRLDEPKPSAHLVARVPAAKGATQRLVLSSHVDTKTDLLDHVQRAPLDVIGLPLVLVMIAGALAAWREKWPRFVRVAQAAGVLNGLSFFVVLSAGAFVSARSHGALDSGAGCAVLVNLAERLHAKPLEHTDVELVFFTGEELGVHGSPAYVAQRLPSQCAGGCMPTRVINLDGVGASEDLAFFRRERFTVESYAPSAEVRAVLDAAHEAKRGVPLHETFYPASTDARTFLRAGVPAITLTSDLPEHAIQRGMHSRLDARERVRLEALTSTSDIILDAARRLDGAR